MKKHKKIIILGCVGNCIDILETVNDINAARQSPKYKVIGFLDDDPAHQGKMICGVRVLGPLRTACNFRDSYFINGIGSPSSFWKKKTIIEKAKIPAGRFETVIHPSAFVSASAYIGFGSVILQNVTVASNVTIGNHIIILPNTVISHDNTIGDYCCIAGGVVISGKVKIGKSCYVGAHSALIEGIKIGDYSLIGMGSVVLNDVPPKSVVVGNPAKFLRHTVKA